MFKFLFSGIHSMTGSLADHPKIIMLGGLSFILVCSMGIILWEVPSVKAAYQSNTAMDDCAWRSRAAFVIPEKRTQANRFNDMCGEEAREWTVRLLAVQEEKSPFANSPLGDEIASMTEGYPIRQMALFIARYDRDVAALLVGIAKKESNWGKRVPRSSDGMDCFNYWGFKGAGSRGVAMGHGCFGSPEEAVERVGNRVAELVRIRSTSKPKDFTIWKCGSSCATHSPESVRKWISDVDQYYQVLASR